MWRLLYRLLNGYQYEVADLQDCVFFRVAVTPMERRRAAIEWETMRARAVDIRDSYEEEMQRHTIRERQLVYAGYITSYV